MEDVMSVIVSRHPAAIAFARGDERFTTARVLDQATEDDVRGQVVAGNLPLHLACLCQQYYAIELPAIALSQRGQELSGEEMVAAGARLVHYRVERLDN
jgi:putative CRISPR-associated protein (TIGR02620 family)